jgi:hypothetical protein
VRIVDLHLTVLKQVVTTTDESSVFESAVGSTSATAPGWRHRSPRVWSTPAPSL